MRETGERSGWAYAENAPGKTEINPNTDSNGYSSALRSSTYLSLCYLIKDIGHLHISFSSSSLGRANLIFKVLSSYDGIE
jgi:hypothetical protein